MIELPESFEQGDYHYTRILRSGSLALYEVEHARFHAGFEVIQVKPDRYVNSWRYQGMIAARDKYLALQGVPWDRFCEKYRG